MNKTDEHLRSMQSARTFAADSLNTDDEDLAVVHEEQVLLHDAAPASHKERRAHFVARKKEDEEGDQRVEHRPPDLISTEALDRRS